MKSELEASPRDGERTEPDAPAKAFATKQDASTPSLAGRALPERSAAPSDTLSNWLDLLCKLLRLPTAEKEEIRSELDSHLRDRVRDFMLAGLDADESARRAIDELGNAADLAERFRATSKDTQRRFLMNVAGIGLATAAVVFSVVALTQRSTDAAVTRAAQVAQAEDERAKAEQAREEAVRTFLVEALVQAPPERVPIVTDLLVRAEASLEGGDGLNVEARQRLATALALVQERDGARRAGEEKASKPAVRTSTYEPRPNEAMEQLATIEVHLKDGDTYATFFDQLKASGRVSIRDPQLESIGVSRELVLPGALGKTNAAAAIQALNDSFHGDAVDAIAARLAPDGTIVVSSQESFDKQEKTLVTYDIASIVQRRIENTSDPVKASEVVAEVSTVITQLVQQEHWADNGGNRARITKFGTKLFIEAPARFHPQIQWVLEELKAIEQSAAHSGTGDRDAAPKADRTDRALAVRWQDGVPNLRDLPLLSNMFTTSGSVTEKVGAGPLVIKATDGGKVQVIGPSGVLEAAQVQIDTPAGHGHARVAEGSTAMKVCTLTVADAGSIASFVQDVSKATPILSTANGVPEVKISTNLANNQLLVIADAQQLRILDQLIELLDRGPLQALPAAVPAERQYHSKVISASTLRELLGKAFNVSPVLKQCAVPRIMEVHDNHLTLTATADQLVLVDRLVGMMDPSSGN